MTMTQEMAVKSQPQRPMPVSTSSPDIDIGICLDKGLRKDKDLGKEEKSSIFCWTRTEEKEEECSRICVF